MNKTNKETYEKLAGEYNERCKQNIQNQEYILKPFLHLVEGNTILDIGSGVGIDCKILSKKGFKTTGIDVAKNMINYAKKNCQSCYPPVEFHNIDFMKLKTDKHFDGILMDAFFPLFKKKDANKVLEKVKSLMSQEAIGLMCLSTNSAGEGVYVKKDYKQKLKRYRAFYTEQEIREILVNNGFKTIFVYYNYDKEHDKKWMNILFKNG